MPPTSALREALNASIASGHFVDTKIYLFSHRNSTGDICKPKVLYANSVVLQSVPYFNDLFSGNYLEAATRDLDEDIADEDVIAEHYDYDSDSDLEDVEDLKAAKKPSPLLRGHPLDPSYSASNEDEGSESDNGAAGDRLQETMCSEEHVPAYYDERIKEGKVIKVQDVAFVTFQAFLFYLYTGRIEFAPFGSDSNRKTRAAEIISLAPDHVPQPSPKSIYRLADKYDVPELKFLASEEIREGLGQCDAVRETFSRFASHYPEILGMHVENLASTLTEADSGEVEDRLDERLRAFAEGQIDYASEAFSSLWKILTQSGGSGIGYDIGRINLWRSSSVTLTTPLEVALIKSIRQGSFCDRKYLAKRNSAGNQRAPVYISSIVLENVEPALNTLIRDSWRSGAGCSEDECDSDSDYEDMVSSREERGPRSDEPDLAITSALSTGALPTWSALFFFLYTGDLKFGPLKSQELGRDMHHVGENGRPIDPPLCSPKSICYLAAKLGLWHLEGVAYKDVAAKTSTKNVVREAFSKSSARLPGVREMQCRLLVSSSRTEEIAKATEEHIRGLAGGQMSHRYAASSLGFRFAVEEKRRNLNARTTRQAVVLPLGPTLQCQNQECSQKGILVFVQDIGKRTRCGACLWALRCYVCGSYRNPARPKCRGCRRKWS